jgi:hypothetical protein
MLGWLLTGCGEKTPAQPSQTNSTASGNPITAPVDYLGAVAKAKKASEKTIDVAALRQAINLFYAQEDRYPRDLQELVTAKYIGSLPPPPAGMQFKYDAKSGEFSIVAK